VSLPDVDNKTRDQTVGVELTDVALEKSEGWDEEFLKEELGDALARCDREPGRSCESEVMGDWPGRKTQCGEDSMAT
jgi:hypothetical protein